MMNDMSGLLGFSYTSGGEPKAAFNVTYMHSLTKERPVAKAPIIAPSGLGKRPASWTLSRVEPKSSNGTHERHDGTVCESRNPKTGTPDVPTLLLPTARA